MFIQLCVRNRSALAAKLLKNNSGQGPFVQSVVSLTLLHSEQPKHLHSERPKLYRVLAVVSAKGLMKSFV